MDRGVRVLLRPTTERQRTLGWLLSAVIFVGTVFLYTNANPSANPESAIPAIAVATGKFSCIYPGASTSTAIVAPLFPIIAGALEAPLAIGHHTSRARACADALSTTDAWLRHRDAHVVMIVVGLLMWFVLAFAARVALRASSMSRTFAEPLALVLLALTPAIVMSFSYEFHPEDALSVGLLLLSAALVARSRVIFAGVAGALAVFAQQFAILGVVALFVVISRELRVKFALAGALVGAIILGTLAIVTDGRVTEFFSASKFTPLGATWVSHFGLSHSAVSMLSRGTPIVATALTAGLARWWRRGALSQVGELTLILAVAMAWRLLFEVNIYGYYFMALATLLIVGVLASGRGLIALTLWLAALAVAYVPPGGDALMSGWGGSNGPSSLVLAGSGLLMALMNLRPRVGGDLARPVRSSVPTSVG